MVTDPFRPGDSVAWRVRVRLDGTGVDHLVNAQPMTVVRDSPDEVALLIQPGSVMKRRNAVKGGPHGRVVLAVGEGFTDWIWHPPRSRLVVRRPQDHHAVSLFWKQPGALDFWYIDLASPLRRTSAGFDSVDHGLDVVVQPDLSSWRWKDEDELAWTVEAGRYTRAEADDLFAEGERAVERLIRERDRFEPWLDWRPDPAWHLATLPAGWDAP